MLVIKTIRRSLPIIVIFLVLFLALILTACSAGPATPPAATWSPEVTQTATTAADTPTPSPTPEPMALTVNGQGVPLAEYQAEMAQIQAAAQALGQSMTPEEQRKRVIDELVNEALMANAASAAGYEVDDAALQAEEERVSAQLGGAAALQDWQTRMGYTEASFRSALRRSLAAAWQRDQILASVPEAAEQVHARQILVLTQAAADQVEQRLKQAGANFATLAFGYDLSTGGDLGWFPRGFLTQPAVEDAAFALQAGETSAIIHTDYGYHIIQVIAREDNRPLTPEARQVLGQKALQRWLDEQRQQAQVEELAP
jgi:peptidyl-prolyl cis-trans isomerase C